MRRVVVSIKLLRRRRQIAEKSLEVERRVNDATSALAVSMQEAADAFRKLSEAAAKANMKELLK